jgi:hypothetical protein
VTLPDLINGTFESCGAFFIFQSVLKLHRDKMVRGVSWLHSGFFAVWGYWNLFYYPHLEQWVSFVGGIGIVSTNTFWLCQIVYYTRQEKARVRQAARLAQPVS